MANQIADASTPNTESFTVSRRYLTEREVERLIEAAKSNRHGHRDATMILVAYRHGLRASEVCGLEWHQIELDQGRLHVRRAKRGTPSVHPIRGDERSVLCADYAARTLRKPMCSFPSVAVRSAQWASIISSSASGRPLNC